MAMNFSDSGITFADGSLQPTALTTGTQTIAGAKTFSSNVTLSAGVQGALVLGTAQNTTSGTSIDFTSIPSWAKRITVMFNGVSTSGASPYVIRLGTAGGIEATSYSGGQASLVNATGVGGQNNSTGFAITNPSAAYTVHGLATIVLMDSSANRWAMNSAVGRSDAAGVEISGGTKALSGVLTQLRLTTVGGTDTFDAGSVNIMYEG